MHSYHIFMYPFRWDRKDEESLDERVRLFEDKEIDGWELEEFDFKKSYNEYSYFYDFVRDVLYDKSISKLFNKKIENGVFEFCARDKKYELELEYLRLRVFDTGVAILMFYLKNQTYPKLDDVLAINDFGRRVYPQFVGDCFDLDAPRKAFLPGHVRIKSGDEEMAYSDFGECAVADKKEITVSKYITELLGETFKNKTEIKPVVDDRMFVVSWYGNDTVACNSSRLYIKSEDWYKYLFVDSGSLNCQNDEMMEELLKAQTYARWSKYNTLWGVSRYSMVCLSSSLETLKRDGASFIPAHVQSMYCQMAMLWLAQRASVLRFSQEVASISRGLRIQNSDEQTYKDVSALYEHYIGFVNKLHFKEVTAQEQGIEIYNIGCKTIGLHENIKNLDEQIAELNQYLTLKIQEKSNEKISKLTQLSSILVPPALISSLYGVNFLNFDEVCFSGAPYWLSMPYWSWFISTVISVMLAIYFVKNKNKKIVSILAITLFSVISYVFFQYMTHCAIP